MPEAAGRKRVMGWLVMGPSFCTKKFKDRAL
jgi:hypothetical protein